MSRKSVLKSIAVLASAFSLAAAGPILAQETDDDSTISLVQTIEVKEFEGLKFNVEEHNVQRGDSLVRILQKRGVVGRGILPEQLVRLIKKLNPELGDMDVLLIGQKLVLPEGPIEGISPPPPVVAARTDEPPAADTGKEEPTASRPSTGPTEKINVPGLGEMEFRRVRVERGDLLADILRREGVPAPLIFNEMTSLVVRVNPQIHNPDLIYAGTDILIPVETTWSAAVKSGVRFSPAPSAAGSPRGTGTSTAAVRVRPEKSSTSSSPHQILAPPPALPSAQHIGTRTALGLIFTRMGEQFISKGQHFLPLRTGGQITINANSFPILELNTGQRIILDLDQRLPNEMTEMIQSNFPNYSVFRPKKGENLTGMLDRLFSEAQYYRVQKGQPWTFNRGVRIKINADWIVWATEEDHNAGRATVINVPRTPAEGTSPAIAGFLASNGVQVIDYHPKGNMIGPDTSQAPAGKDVNVEDLRSADLNGFVKSILTLVGQKFETDLSIPLVTGSSKGEGFNLSVQAPIYFSRGAANYVVNLEGLTPDMEKMLRDHKFKVIGRLPGESPEDVARNLLKAMNIRAEDGLTIVSSPSRSKRSVEVTMPGVVFKTGGKDLLLTPTEIPRSLASLLTKPNLRVVQYIIANPS